METQTIQFHCQQGLVAQEGVMFQILRRVVAERQSWQTAQMVEQQAQAEMLEHLVLERVEHVVETMQTESEVKAELV